ncbi:hypothetical protein P7K49_013305, partial [Saguinus oedipus]
PPLRPESNGEPMEACSGKWEVGSGTSGRGPCQSDGPGDAAIWVVLVQDGRRPGAVSELPSSRWACDSALHLPGPTPSLFQAIVWTAAANSRLHPGLCFSASSPWSP